MWQGHRIEQPSDDPPSDRRIIHTQALCNLMHGIQLFLAQVLSPPFYLNCSKICRELQVPHKIVRCLQGVVSRCNDEGGVLLGHPMLVLSGHSPKSTLWWGYFRVIAH